MVSQYNEYVLKKWLKTKKFKNVFSTAKYYVETVTLFLISVWNYT